MRHSEPHAFWFAPTTYGSQYQWWMLVDWNEVTETHNHRGDWFCVLVPVSRHDGTLWPMS